MSNIFCKGKAFFVKSGFLKQKMFYIFCKGQVKSGQVELFETKNVLHLQKMFYIFCKGQAFFVSTLFLLELCLGF
jgi:hypothetical protein